MKAKDSSPARKKLPPIPRPEHSPGRIVSKNETSVDFSPKIARKKELNQRKSLRDMREDHHNMMKKIINRNESLGQQAQGSQQGTPLQPPVSVINTQNNSAIPIIAALPPSLPVSGAFPTTASTSTPAQKSSKTLH